MEQLEIKHLGRRLAYGLKILDGWGDVRTMKYTHLDDENNGFITGVKPILRPLSDLTKEITNKANELIPAIELCKIIGDIHNDDRDSEWEIKDTGARILCKTPWDLRIEIFYSGSICFSVYDTWNYCEKRTKNQFKAFEFLLEHHFHLDEPEGTWIDVNTLPKNPYE